MLTRFPLSLRRATLLLTLPLALSACDNAPLGSELDEGGFGEPTRLNIAYHSGELNYAAELGERFAREVPTMITFAFNSAELDHQAQAILRQQAAFILAFPEVHFTVYGHTDLVGSDAYNHRLGERRARAAVNYLIAQGVDRSRLHALVSLGETQPIIATQEPELRNRRTVTEVTAFVATHPLVLDGQFARIVYRGYVGGGGSE